MKELRGTCFTEHRHRCSKCKLVFQHDPREIDGENEQHQHQHSAAHQCPSCGTSQYEIYQGKDAAVCRNNGVIPKWEAQPLPPLNSELDPKCLNPCGLSDDEVGDRLAAEYMDMDEEERKSAESLLTLMALTSPNALQKSQMVRKKIKVLQDAQKASVPAGAAK